MGWVIGIGLFVLATVSLVLFVYGGTHLGGEEEDARDDYLAYKKYMDNNNITSGCPVIRK